MVRFPLHKGVSARRMNFGQLVHESALLLRKGLDLTFDPFLLSSELLDQFTRMRGHLPLGNPDFLRLLRLFSVLFIAAPLRRRDGDLRGALDFPQELFSRVLDGLLLPPRLLLSLSLSLLSLLEVFQLPVSPKYDCPTLRVVEPRDLKPYSRVGIIVTRHRCRGLVARRGRGGVRLLGVRGVVAAGGGRTGHRE